MSGDFPGDREVLIGVLRELMATADDRQKGLMRVMCVYAAGSPWPSGHGWVGDVAMQLLDDEEPARPAPLEEEIP